jgi:RelA/SpoT family (p)ppGpp synthetase
MYQKEVFSTQTEEILSIQTEEILSKVDSQILDNLELCNIIENNDKSDKLFSSSFQAEHKFGIDEKSDLQYLLGKCKKYLPNFDEQLIKLAFNYCVIAHEGKLRKSGDKFYTHPLAVALIVIQEIPMDNESVVAALLHNVLDESDIYTYEDIRFAFGTTISQIVEGVSRIKFVESQHIERPDQMDNYRKLLLTLFTDIRIILIKLADKLHNLRTLQYLSIDSQKQIAKETLEIYAPFANRFGLRNIKFELEDLSFKYYKPEEYKHIEDTIKGTHKDREQYVERFKKPIVELFEKEGLLKQENVHFKISGRAKHIYSIYNKTLLRKKKVEELYDIFAIRIILDTENPLLCFYAYGIVANYYKPIPETFKDYISSPKSNGYSSLHTAVAGPDDKIVEVQIRTQQMHIASEVGVAAHFRYKSGVQNSILEDQNIQYWLDDVKDIFENIGNEDSSKLLDIISNNMLQDKIYVFTPKDEFRQLAKGATALDFAFDIHTNIGLSCIGAKVNGKLCAVNHILNSGDRVEIITSKKQEPSREWFNFITTPKANTKLIKYFKEKENEAIKIGKDIWEKANVKNGFYISPEELLFIVKTYNFDTEADFFKAIGNGSIEVERIYQFAMFRISDKLRFDIDSEFNPESAFRIYKDDESILNQNFQNFKDISGFKFEFLKCCNPLPGDPLFGIQENSELISAHSITCPKYKKLLQTHPNDLIMLDWEEFPEIEFHAKLHIIAEDSANLLENIINSLTFGNNINENIENVENNIENIEKSYNNIQITSLSYEVNNSVFEGFIGFIIDNKSFISEIISVIKAIENIKIVERID